MASVWFLRAGGGSWDSAWESVEGVYATEEDAMAAQIRYEDKKLQEHNEWLVRYCQHCERYENVHGLPGVPKCRSGFKAKEPVTKVPNKDWDVWYTEEELGKDDF